MRSCVLEWKTLFTNRLWMFDMQFCSNYWLIIFTNFNFTIWNYLDHWKKILFLYAFILNWYSCVNCFLFSNFFNCYVFENGNLQHWIRMNAKQKCVTKQCFLISMFRTIKNIFTIVSDKKTVWQIVRLNTYFYDTQNLQLTGTFFRLHEYL